MNLNIIKQFELLIKQIVAEQLNAHVEQDSKEISKHNFRLQHIKKALSIIKNLDFEITNSNELKEYSGIGSGTLNRIDEILKTGKLSELKVKYNKKKQARIDSIQELSQIIGVGEKIAKKLVIEHGVISVKDLKNKIKNKDLIVNEKIKLGLKYYGIVQGNIPKDETKKIEKYLIKIATQIDSQLHVIICGSYRRGRDFSNDIDVVIYHPLITNLTQIDNPVQSNIKGFLDLLVNRLTTGKKLLDHMTDKKYKRKYMGFFKYNSEYNVRRIDIRIVPIYSVYTAMLYNTGPFELNQYMRQEAIKRNMLLNEYGLYLKKNDDYILIPTKSEEEIFKKLNIEYMTPIQRDTFSLNKFKKINASILNS